MYKYAGKYASTIDEDFGRLVYRIDPHRTPKGEEPSCEDCWFEHGMELEYPRTDANGNIRTFYTLVDFDGRIGANYDCCEEHLLKLDLEITDEIPADYVGK